jgi:hypothetical protein
MIQFLRCRCAKRSGSASESVQVTWDESSADSYHVSLFGTQSAIWPTSYATSSAVFNRSRMACEAIRMYYCINKLGMLSTITGTSSAHACDTRMRCTRRNYRRPTDLDQSRWACTAKRRGCWPFEGVWQRCGSNPRWWGDT